MRKLPQSFKFLLLTLLTHLLGAVYNTISSNKKNKPGGFIFIYVKKIDFYTIIHKSIATNLNTKPLGHSKGGLVLIQNYLYFDPYQIYEERFVSSNWVHLT